MMQFLAMFGLGLGWLGQNGGIPAASAPVTANNYAAENGTDLYVAENGTDNYVTES
jgi:hypothetical protein